MKELTLGSFFDGIGGWLLAAVHNGVRPVWASEIDDFPAAVTAHHFPDVKQLGDITKIASHGGSLMRNIGEYPSVVRESFLSQILENSPQEKYYLSQTACMGILRRAKERGKVLPPMLEQALKAQSGMCE